MVKKRPMDVPEPYSSIIDRQMEVDRLWFAQHPAEHVYVRDLTPGEFWPVDMNAYPFVRVTQLSAGVRVREPSW